MAQPSRHEMTPVLNGARVLVVEGALIIMKELESILIDGGAEIAGLGSVASFAWARPAV
jgi:hypothetical protein